MIEKIKDSKILGIVNEVMEKLDDYSPYIYHVSRYNTVYIKFQDERLRVLRIGDHSRKKKYPDKWNIVIGGQTKEMVSRTGKKSFYFNEKSIRLFIRMIKKYHQPILER